MTERNLDLDALDREINPPSGLLIIPGDRLLTIARLLLTETRRLHAENADLRAMITIQPVAERPGDPPFMQVHTNPAGAVVAVTLTSPGPGYKGYPAHVREDLQNFGAALQEWMRQPAPPEDAADG